MADITDLVPGGILNDRQLRFVQEYIIDLNAKQAAIRAGYSEDCAKEIGSRLLTHVNISRAIAAYRKTISDETHITVGDIIKKLQEVADRCMQAEPVLEFDPEEKAMVPTGEWQFDSKGANTAWATIAKMLGFIDNKAKGNEEGGGFSLTIVTQAAQMQLEKQGLTIDQAGNIIQIGQKVPRETIGGIGG